MRYLRSATSSRRVIGIVGLGGKGWQSNSMTAEALGRRPDGGGQWLTPNGDCPANGSPSGPSANPKRRSQKNIVWEEYLNASSRTKLK